jgi:hypothetical protein
MMEQGAILDTAQSLIDTFEHSSLQISQNVTNFNSGSDFDDVEHKDPAIVQRDVAAQTVSVYFVLLHPAS